MIKSIDLAVPPQTKKHSLPVVEEENESEESLPVQIVYESSSEDEEELESAKISDSLFTRPLLKKINERDYDFVLTPKKTNCYFKKITFNLLAKTPRIREKRVVVKKV